MNFSRRGLLIGATSTALLPYLPRSASAVEPLTALQAGAAVVGIVSGILGYASNEDFKRKLAEINAKLDQVVRLQAAILQEIQSLKLFISEALVRDRRDATANALNAQKDRYDILVASPVNRETRPLYDFLISSVEQSAFEISRYDFSAYIPFSTGIAIDLAVYRILLADKDRLAVLKSKVFNVYNSWLDANSAQSVTFLIAQVGIDVRAAIDKLNAASKVSTLRSYTKGNGRRSYCHWSTVLTVNGDFDTGYSGSVAEVKGECEILPDDPCSPRRPCFIGVDMEPIAKPLAIPAKIPEKSGYDLVDKLNADRNAIIDQMHRLANLSEIKAQIEQLRAAFA